MKIFIYGSCRVWDLLAKDFTILNTRTLMHDISQYIQELKFYNRKIDIPSQYYQYMYYSTYRLKINENKELMLNENLKYINEADIIVVEISTIKYILKDTYYLDIQQTSYNKNNITDALEKKYDSKTFRQKMEEFLKLLSNKKILFVGHIYTNDMCIDKLKVREQLNNWIEENIKECDNAYFFNPSTIVAKYGWNEIMKDTSHYSENGKKIMSCHIKEFIEFVNKK